MGREQGRGGEGRTRPEGLPLPGVSGGEETRAREVGGRRGRVWEKPGVLQSMGRRESDTTEQLN